VELAAGLVLRGHAIDEVAAAYAARRTGRSKMRHVPELLKALKVMVKMRLVGHA